MNQSSNSSQDTPSTETERASLISEVFGIPKERAEVMVSNLSADPELLNQVLEVTQSIQSSNISVAKTTESINKVIEGSGFVVSLEPGRYGIDGKPVTFEVERKQPEGE